MVLYLSSYKVGNRTDILKEWIKNNNNKILLIPNARDSKNMTEEEKIIIENEKMSLENNGFSVTILDLKNIITDLTQIKGQIDKSTGGETKQIFRGIIPSFNKFMETMSSPLVDPLETKIKCFILETYSKVFCDPDFIDISPQILKM